MASWLRLMGSSSLTRDRTNPPFIGITSLSHWTTREVPPFISPSITWVSLTVWDVMIRQALKFWFLLAPLCQSLEMSWMTPHAPSFPPSPSISLHPSPFLSILPYSLIPRAPGSSLNSAHLCLYISKAECKWCSNLSRPGKGRTDFWMTDLLRSLENEFSREIKD